MLSRNLFPAAACLMLGLGLSMFALAQDDADDANGRGIFDQAAVAKDDLPPEPEGVQSRAMGVVHEAFASPTVFSAQAGAPIAKEPPAPIEELPPEQKPDGDNVQWVNGYFAYDDQKEDFYWVSGLWRNIPPSMEWVPGTWNRGAEGWQYFSGFWRRASEGELQVVPPPPEPLQTADPPAPDGESTYIPGAWVYRETRYVWRPACWVAHRPGWVWAPARYMLTHCGWVFVDGYWDYVLRDRGLLYCPVRIDPVFYRRPGWVYRPAYVVHDQCLLSCMFVNRRTGGYVFGDYYGDHYRRAGYVSWLSYSVNRRPEPLLSYYRHANRRDPRWETNLVALQTDRYRGVAPRPPVTLVQQTTVIQNNRTQINNLTLIAPVTKIDKTVVPLTTLNTVNWKKQADAAKQMREASQLRAKNEAALAKTLGAVRVGDAAKTLALNLPTTTQTTVVTNKIKNLPPPPSGQRPQLTTVVGKTSGDKSAGDKTTGDKVVIGKAAGKEKEKNPPMEKTSGGATKEKVVVVPPKEKMPVTLPKGKETTKSVTPDNPGKTDKSAPPKDKTMPMTPKDAPPKEKIPLTKGKAPLSKEKPPTTTTDPGKTSPPKPAPMKDKTSPPKSATSDKPPATTPSSTPPKVTTTPPMTSPKSSPPKGTAAPKDNGTPTTSPSKEKKPPKGKG